VTLAADGDMSLERLAGDAGETAFEKLFDMIFN